MIPRPTPFRALATAALLLAAQGCATAPDGPRARAQAARLAQAQALAERAYHSPEDDAVTQALQDWPLPSEHVSVALSLPSRGRDLPIVVYLPGLGESAQAGAVWRQAWAKAGYAVLSVQALEDDARAWSSELARALEFKTLAQQRHAAEPLAQRIDRLAAVLDEARRRAQAGDALCSRLDFSRMAVAGYDLGAQAAMVLAGEHEPGASPAGLSGRFRAAIVLSPIVVAGQDRPERFDTIAKPVLSISSTDDVDPTGFVESASMRTRPFERMPAGDKFLLVLDGASHAQLSGAVQRAHDAADEERAAPERRRNGGARRGARDPELDSRQPPLALGRREWRPPERHDEAAFATAISAVSTAFLDATLRDSPPARRWLAEQVPDWLQSVGRWRQR